MSEFHFDPFGAQHRDDPYPAYAEMRRRAPVAKVEKNGAYAVSRYDDVAFVLRHPELFSSSAMQTMFTNSFTPGGAASTGMGLSGAEAARLAQLMSAMPLSIADLLRARSLIASDPPVHGPMRSLVNRGFTPRRIAELEPRVRAIARASLDALAGKSEFDLVSEFSVPLPVAVIALLLGVPRERSADFKRWSDCLVASATGGGTLRPETVLQSFSELTDCLVSAIEQRRREPQDDLISTLIRGENGEAGLTPVEVVMFTVLLLVAGNETTTNLLGNTLIALMRHPDQLELVQRDPGRIAALVEEALRYDGPIQFVFRRATQDVEVAGVAIPAGAPVMPLLGSANRDETQFANPDAFDASRNTQGHLAFGLGIHFCLGASLARLEARVALEELVGRYQSFELAQPRVEYIDSYLVRGPRQLPLRVEPRHRGEAVRS